MSCSRTQDYDANGLEPEAPQFQYKHYTTEPTFIMEVNNMKPDQAVSQVGYTILCSGLHIV